MEILGNVVAFEMKNNLSKVTPITKCLVVLTKYVLGQSCRDKFSSSTSVSTSSVGGRSGAWRLELELVAPR